MDGLLWQALWMHVKEVVMPGGFPFPPPPTPCCTGAGLRAAFACDAASLAGFGGLVMRLRGEGHGQLHVVGPSGKVETTKGHRSACSAMLRVVALGLCTSSNSRTATP